jgi:hypothetical protein
MVRIGVVGLLLAALALAGCTAMGPVGPGGSAEDIGPTAELRL